jgi:hypothetical protein
MALVFIQQIIGGYNMNTMLVHPSAQKDYVLNAQDRCDRCNAPAYVKIIGKVGDLLFCGHHYNKAMDNAVGYENMMKFAEEIIDERDRLDENRTQGDSY